MSGLTWFRRLSFVTAAVCAVTLSSCNSRTDNAGKDPRVATIPDQNSEGGAAFSLDLEEWVTDPNGEDLTFDVSEGGGVVIGGVYHHVFDTVGSKTVNVNVSNGQGSTDLSFVVMVETGHQAVIQAGTSLVLLDRSTVTRAREWESDQLYSPQFLVVSNSPGYVDTYKSGLRHGQVVYERTHGVQTDLYVYDAFNPGTVRLGDDPNFQTHEMYEGETSDRRIIFSCCSATDTNLYIYNVVTQLTRVISAVKDVHERNVNVDSNDDVYFESGPTTQRDVYVYHPSTDQLVAVATGSQNEVIVGVVPGGGVVFSRDEGADDVDLWFYKPGVGFAQVATDVHTAGFQDRTLTFNASMPGGQVVFTETVSATDSNLYYWDSAAMTTTTVAANSDVPDVFHGTTSNGKIVYTHQVSSTDWDIHSKTVGGSDEDLSKTGEKDVFQAITAVDDVVMFRDNNDLYIYDDGTATLLAADTGGGAALTFVTSLNGGNVVYLRAGSGLQRWDVSNNHKPVAANGIFAGTMHNGMDFVVQTTVSAQGDLHVWREDVDALELVTANASDERFVVSTAVGDGLVFSRRGPYSNYDLYVWDSGLGIRQLSGTDESHFLTGTFFLDNR